MQMHREKYKSQLKNKELEDIFLAIEQEYKAKLFTGSQRALQFGGAQLRKHEFKMYNCLSGVIDRPEAFGEYFYLLLCGCGVGFSVQKHHIAKLPMIRPRTKQPKTHIIDDSIEGWATALDVLMSSYFIGGGKYPEYEGRRVYFDFTHIRPKGAHISGGFKAPGHEPLQKALGFIERLLSESAEDGILKSIVIYDILMHTADAVLSGGVRRAATICIFSIDDHDMMTAKTGDWFSTNPQRARSNNSALCVRDSLVEDDFFRIFDNVKQFGEPGFIFADNTEQTFNPCVEIGMYPYTESGISGWQGCNLVEINGTQCVNEERFYRACFVASAMSTLQAGYTNFKFVGESTKEIFEREALLGVSMTGWMNNPNILLNEEVLKKGARIVKETNKLVAKLIGINPAARTTCVKPAGNVSVLLGTASGIHFEHAPRFLRSMQINKQSDVAKAFVETNPYMVDERDGSDTDYTISFPIVDQNDSKYKYEYSGIEFLEFVKLVQINWVMEGTNIDLCVDKTVRHNVSNTVQVKNDEWNEVAKYLFENRDYFAGVSFIGEFGDKDYYQAPFIRIFTAEEIVDTYGEAALFASGLIVDSTVGFDNLWKAINVVKFNGTASQELKDTRADWIRRFHKFANNYFQGDIQKAEYCLKDVYLLHKWSKIQQNYRNVDIASYMINSKNIDIDTLGAVACHGGACEV